MEGTLISTTLTPGQRFWRMLKPDKKEITNVYIYALFNGLVNLSLPLGIQAIINLIQGGQMSTSWIVLVCIVVLGVGITGILQIKQLRITENLQQKIFTRAAFEFAYRIPKIKMEALYRHYAPELMNRFFDTISLQKGLSKILMDFSTAVLQVIFGLILLSLYHPFFILFSLVLVLLIYIMFRLTGTQGLQTSHAESKHKYGVAHWLEEMARSHVTFKLSGNDKLALSRTDKRVEGYLGAREKHFGILVRQYSLMVVFKVLVALGLLAIGGILVMEQQMNIGQFVAAEIIILLVIASVEKLILSFETIYDVLTSLEKIGQVTDLELENVDGVDIREECKDEGIEVKLDKVSFSYPDYGKNILDDVSMTIPAGTKMMVTGPSGSGKSTLLYILAQLYTVQDGSISYDGLTSRNLTQDSLRTITGDCLAQERLFEGSLLDNITMGRDDATFANVKEVAQKLKLDKFVSTLPQGFDSILDPDGKRLPRSVIQKILLARSVAHMPKLLLLEDALEHIEENERKEIIDYLTSDESPWTLVAVSTDKYFSKSCDALAIMRDGEVSSIDWRTESN